MENGTKERRVVCAAIRINGIIICGVRHYDKMMHKVLELIKQDGKAEQGFVDQYGVFMDREEAYQVAQAAKQIIYEIPGPKGMLFSEHLY